MIIDKAIEIVLVVLGLGALIFLHESGHFVFCKLVKIPVEEFGFGFPPRLVKLFRYDGTDFTLNAIPFGAFVRPRGENDPNVPGGMSEANPWKRFGVLIGGPLMNLITGMLLFSLVFTIDGVPHPDKIVITDTNPGSPAEQVGLMTDDLILSVNGEAITSIDRLSTLVRANRGRDITITVLRDGQTLTFTTIPRVYPPEGEGALGIGMTEYTEPATWPQTIPYAIQETVQQGYDLISLPVMLITGKIPADQARLVSPIGLFSMWSRASEIDTAVAASNPEATPITRLTLLAIISVALGFTNLLPLPALDGGRILFLLPEILFRKRVPAEKEAYVHAIGFIALIILMFVIVAQDIINPLTF